MREYITYNGKRYTKSALAKELGVHRNTIMNRLNAGCSIDDLAKCGRDKIIEHNGERKSMSEWSRSLGLSRNAVRERIKHGWTEQDAVTTR